MSFDLTEERLFKATVGIKIPTGTDAFDNQAITCEYKIITEPEMAALIKGGGDEAVLKTILKSVDGFVDGDGEPIYLDDGLIDAIVARSYLTNPIINTYYNRIAGHEPALKNV